MYVQNTSSIWVPVGITPPAVPLPTNVQQVGGVGVSSSSPGDGMSNPGSLAEYLVFLELWTGAGWDRIRTPNIFKKLVAVSVTAGTPVSVWTPAASKKFRMMGFILATTVAASILMEDATGSANEFFRVPLLQASVPIASPQVGNGYLSTTANNQLFIDVTVTGVVSGVIYGTEE